MFVRWKRRERTRRKQPTGEWVKSAVLVRSVHTEVGPRLRHICSLGLVREGYERDYWEQVAYWAAATRNLDRVGIAGKERARIEAVLESVVPKPCGKKKAAIERALRELTDQLERRATA
jgi:hypothetical protein